MIPFELYLVGFAAVAVGGLFARHKYLIWKNNKLEAENNSLEKVVQHHEAIAETKQKRSKGQKKRVQENVEKTVEDEFSDFYD